MNNKNKQEKLKKSIQTISISSLLFIIVFFIDYVLTLFSINESGIYYSRFGLRYTVVMTEQELDTLFALTPKTIYTYLVFIGIGIVLSIIIQFFRELKCNNK